MKEFLKKTRLLAVRALQNASKWVSELGDRSLRASDTPVLLSLTPKYDAQKHGLYVDLIEAALANNDDPVRNIALTGSYGVGKSSILEEVARRHRNSAIVVSLSTLGSPESGAQVGEQTEGSSSKTNRIQKEIVKQLLYSQDPVKTPGSRYRRTTGIRLWRSIRLAFLLAVPLALLSLLAGWTALIAEAFSLPSGSALLQNLIILLAAAAFFVGILNTFHNRIQLDALNAGAATISLSKPSATYFDEYLDEIVYFFETVKHDVVIFEDIDRFEETRIFETLRILNGVLNGAGQLRGRRIRFLYAIKDSIFEEIGNSSAQSKSGADSNAPEKATLVNSGRDAAESETARTNRTKFFDLVIPVVPFVTHRSARDLLTATMSDIDHAVSEELVDLAARHVADMRLLKNIRNEFVVFKRQIIDNANIELRQDALFAMVLYKSTHLADFELIKLGKSKLDGLYSDSRKLVSSNIEALNSQIFNARAKRSNLRTPDSISNRLGNEFGRHIERTLGHISVDPTEVQSRQLDGVEFQDSDLQTPEFWEKLAASGGSIVLRYYDRHTGRSPAVKFSRAEIAEVLGEPIDSKVWVESERDRLEQEISDAIDHREFLSHADMSALMGRSEFTLRINEAKYSFEELANERLGSDLALQLLAAGYIDRNFTLYTSTFHAERVTANATNFIIKNVDPNVMDVHFRLKDGEPELILREKGRAILHDKAVLNITFVDYLLSGDPGGGALVVEQLVKPGRDARSFLVAYLESGKYKDGLVKAIAPSWPEVFTFLMTSAQLEDSARQSFVNVALLHASADTDYAVDANLEKLFRASSAMLSVFTSNETSPERAKFIARLVNKTGSKLQSLSPLGVRVLDAVLEFGDYEISRENLLVALKDAQHELSLDEIASADSRVYRRVLASLPEYMVMLGASTSTIVSPSAFVSTVNEIASVDPNQLDPVIARSAPGCVVSELSDVTESAWTSLVLHGRILASFANVEGYIREMGLDPGLARLLEQAGTIECGDGISQESRHALAIVILNASEELSSAKVRVELIDSLELDEYVPASEIPIEAGELLGRLLESGIVADTSEAFSRLGDDDFFGLELAMTKSQNFSTFASSAEFPARHLSRILASESIPNSAKDALIDRFSELTAGLSRDNLQLIATFTLQRERTLSMAEVERLAREGVEASLVTRLIQQHLATITLDELQPVLTGLGGEFWKLASANGKRPRVPATEANEALVKRLDELGVVASYTRRAGNLHVNMRRQ